MKLRFSSAILLTAITAMCCMASSCDVPGPDSSARVPGQGVHRVHATVQTNGDGLTTEQVAIGQKYDEENDPSKVWYLAVVSASGQVIWTSVVKGKVTSSGKRLDPRTVVALDGANVDAEHSGMKVTVQGLVKRTTEVMEADGTYGDSVPYIYWHDTKGVSQKYMLTGAASVIISGNPIRIKEGRVVITQDNEG